MTNEQMNALTKAIITGFTILAKAHMNAINASHSRQGAFLNTINEDSNCCALPIEPPAPVEANPVAGDGWYDLGPDDVIQKGDFCSVLYADAWTPSQSSVGSTPRANKMLRVRRRKIDAKDGDA
jgi:hypothetical protein